MTTAAGGRLQALNFLISTILYMAEIRSNFSVTKIAL